jgi:dihydroorotase
MLNSNAPVVLRGGHVIDPTQGLDGISDVTICDGKILGVGSSPADAAVIDARGMYVSPGWVDVHVHTYGTLGFADPDSIGIYQGVTSYVEAGGPGIGTIDEFVELLGGQTTTSLYAGCYLSPMGIVGIEHVEGKARSLYDIPIARWLDTVEKHRDLIRYLKFGAFSAYGTGPLKVGKGLAEILGLPIYVHIGEFQQQEGRDSAYEIYRIAGPGDMITHLYHGNACGILDAAGRIRPVVLEAAERGVLFDIGFGGFNFSWSVAEKAVDQGLWPHLISSDLQQFNVTGPTFSLANVMSVFLKLGMPLTDVIERVTSAPAKALSLTDRAGSLKPGMPADLTVFRVEQGQFELKDTRGAARTGSQRIQPAMVFKNGVRIECDLERCQDERNWILQTCEDHIPDRALRFRAPQLVFLARLREALNQVDWPATANPEFDLEKIIELHDVFHRVRSNCELPLRLALQTVFDSFLEDSFRIQVGVLLMRVGRTLALARLGQLTQDTHLAA